MVNLVGTSSTVAVSAVDGTNSAVGGYGVHGLNSSNSGYGVVGEGGSVGVIGLNSIVGGSGVQGFTYNTNGYGVYGDASNGGASAVYGNGGTIAVKGVTSSNNAYGVYGNVYGTNSVGVVGEADYSGGIGVKGYSSASNGYGMWAEASSYVGIRGQSSGTGGFGGMFLALASSPSGACGVYGSANSGGYGVFSQGNAYITGYLTKAGGGYRIDHPTDPANKFLNHHFVESNEMKNVYDGVVTLDASGNANVTMASYFEVANSDYRYQLTAIGASMPNLHISSEVFKGAFSIAGGKAGAKVSWQVTGIRADKWALANNPGVEIEKTEDEKGFFMHPELHGAGSDKHLLPASRTKYVQVP